MGGSEAGRWRLASRLLLTSVIVAALVIAPYVGAANATWQSFVDRELVSVDSAGNQGDRGAAEPAVSMDGRYVAFRARAELADIDNDDERAIYLRDTVDDTTVLVSVNEDGDAGGNGHSYDPAVSADGRYVAFESNASDLVATDGNSDRDIFVRDMQTGTTTLVSVNDAGTDSGNSDSYDAAISADGRYVAFESDASDLVPSDPNGSTTDIFIRDMQTGTTTLVSWDKDGNASNNDSEDPSLCMSGRFVAFESSASDLVENDTNNEWDVFLVDTQTNTTTRVSVASDGTQGDDGSFNASVSAGGLHVAFDSYANNLSAADTNADDDGDRDVFVRDTQAGTTTLITPTPEGAGQRGSRLTSRRALSLDGNYLAFISGEGHVPEDTNSEQDFYVADLMSGEVMLINDDEPDRDGWAENREEPCTVTLAGDGLAVAFDTWDDDVVPSDTNGRRDVFIWQLAPRLPAGDFRWAGATRYDTAIAVSEGTFPRGADTVVIATGDNWPDALCGSALAGAVDGPILLTPTAALPQSVKDEIDRLGAENAYILGGTGVVSAAVETELEGMLDGFVNRLAGMNRYTTSQRVADRVITLYGSAWNGGALVTTGENFADALAGAPLAAGVGWPVVLANPTTGDVYMPEGMSAAVILGGTGAVPMSVEMTLKNSPLSNQDVIRLGGATRYETAAMAAEFGVDNGLLWNGVGIATGENFPDGLTGGASLGLNRTVMLLTPTASLAPAAATKLTDNADDIMTVQFFGGPGAVSTTVENQVKSILGM
jgi:putative cell wall-binding protein/Tol biopolymer transport system component